MEADYRMNMDAIKTEMERIEVQKNIHSTQKCREFAYVSDGNFSAIFQIKMSNCIERFC